MMDTISNRAKAYSYLRFSTPDQMQGDSFRRQIEGARAYAETHGLDLDDDLTFHDLGVSAFRGANVVEGALGQFIEAVDAGRVKPGSFLLVENLDRLSRDKIMSALNRFSSLLEKGINVVTLSDGKSYNADSLNNLPDLMLSLLVMSRAHEESELKSQRLKSAWQAKRDRAANGEHILTSKAPAWLRLDNGSFEVLPERAAIVRRIFALALEGHGKAAIASKFNIEGIEPFGDGPSEARKADGWRASYIQKILRNEAVIGRFQPMRRVYDPETGKKRREPDGQPIDEYFPAIFDDPSVFYRIRRAPSGASGRKGKALSNVLSGLVRCRECNGTMHYVNKGEPPKGGKYLACDNARRKKTCTAKSVRYDVVENAVIASLIDGNLNFAALLENGEAGRGMELMRQIEAVEGHIAEANEAIENLLDALSRRPSAVIEKRLAKYETTIQQLQQDKERLEGECAEVASGASEGKNVLEAVTEFIQIRNSDDEKAIGDLNVRLNAALKKVIDRIEIGYTDDARAKIEDGLNWYVRQHGEKDAAGARRIFEDVAEHASLSIFGILRAPNKSLVIYSDPKKSAWVSGAITTDDKGEVRDFRMSGVVT